MWDSSIQDRLSIWFTFRKRLDRLPFEQAVHEVNKFWWRAPISSQYYSCDMPDQWPDPWQLLVENHYDNIARGLGMLYTITLTKHNPSVEFLCVRNREKSCEEALVWIEQGKYVLNWDVEVRVNNTLQLEAYRTINRIDAQELINNGNSSTKA
jgi:hypothetical protein